MITLFLGSGPGQLRFIPNVKISHLSLVDFLEKLGRTCWTFYIRSHLSSGNIRHESKNALCRQRIHNSVGFINDTCTKRKSNNCAAPFNMNSPQGAHPHTDHNGIINKGSNKGGHRRAGHIHQGTGLPRPGPQGRHDPTHHQPSTIPPSTTAPGATAGTGGSGGQDAAQDSNNQGANEAPSELNKRQNP